MFKILISFETKKKQKTKNISSHITYGLGKCTRVPPYDDNNLSLLTFTKGIIESTFDMKTCKLPVNKVVQFIIKKW